MGKTYIQERFDDARENYPDDQWFTLLEEHISATSAQEDKALKRHVESQVDLDGEPEDIIEETIAAVREWFGIL